MKLNNSPDAFLEINIMPIKYVNGTIVYMRDVACARRQSAADQYRARQRRPAVLMTILKSGAASTLDIVSNVKKLLP